MDSSVDKLDMNEGYGAIGPYRYVSTWMGYEPETGNLCSTHIDFQTWI